MTLDHDTSYPYVTNIHDSWLYELEQIVSNHDTKFDS